MSGQITTSTGTTVQITAGYVVLDNPNAPTDMRDREIGRVVDGWFQPAPFAPWALRPEVLRAIADLIENGETDD